MYNISSDYNDFCKLADELYKEDIFYIKQQIPDKHKIFIVKENDKLLSRACVIHNPLLAYNDKKTLQIGYFESFNDRAACKFLFENIKSYAKENNFKYLIGPINGSTWQKYRITLKSQNPPFFLDNYNKPYYSELFEDTGFKSIARYTSTITENINKSYSRLEKFSDIYKKKGIRIRNFDINNFENELNKIYEVSIDGFQNNFLYTPLSFGEFKKMYEPIKPLINPKWILIAEDNKDRPLAFLFAFDNIYEKNKKSLVVKTLAKISDSKTKGLGSYMTELIHKTAFENNYNEIIHALMHEKNISANIMADDTKILHEYFLYGVEL